MDATVVINNFNYGRYLAEAIESVLAQTVRADVVVVDDGSTDNSRDVIAGYGERVVGVVKENGGQGSALNAGVRHAAGDLVLFLDADDVCHPARVQRVSAALRRARKVDACFHPLRSPLDTPRMPSGVYDFRLRTRLGRPPYVATAMSGIALTRRIVRKIFPMPEHPGIGLSDHYLKWMALLLGRVCWIDEQLGERRIHDANLYANNPALVADVKRLNADELSRRGYRMLARSLRR